MTTKYEIDNVYCEDCYKALKDIPDKSIDCIYTDIPYLYKEGGCGTKEIAERMSRRKIELMGIDYEYDKNLTATENLNLAKQKQQNNVDITKGINIGLFIAESVRIMKKINIFIWCSQMQVYEIMQEMKKYCKNEPQIIVWCKNNPIPMTNNVWLSDVEYCLYFRESGIRLNDGYELKSKFYVSPINKRDKDKFDHPTIKPRELVERHLLHTTQPNDIVLDPFMGSGTTCVACKNTGRHYIGFDIEQKWVDIAKNRLNNIDATGQIGLLTI